MFRPKRDRTLVVFSLHWRYFKLWSSGSWKVRSEEDEDSQPEESVFVVPFGLEIFWLHSNLIRSTSPIISIISFFGWIVTNSIKHIGFIVWFQSDLKNDPFLIYLSFWVILFLLGSSFEHSSLFTWLRDNWTVSGLISSWFGGLHSWFSCVYGQIVLAF